MMAATEETEEEKNPKEAWKREKKKKSKLNFNRFTDMILFDSKYIYALQLSTPN